MKSTKLIANILVTLAAIAGAVYVIATYGEQIVAWCKKVLASLPCSCKVEVVSVEAEDEAPVAAEEEFVAEEEAPAEEAAEEKAEEAVAEEADFAN